MSTRCQTKIEGTDILIYRHCDGYPSSMLKLLLPFVESFMKYRGHDPEYMIAQFVYTLIDDCKKDMAEFYKDFPDKKQTPSYTGYGVDRSIHGDIEYLYGVAKDGSVTVEVPQYRDSDFNGVMKFKTVAKFKVGTTYEAAMERLKKLESKGGRFEGIAS